MTQYLSQALNSSKELQQDVNSFAQELTEHLKKSSAQPGGAFRRDVQSLRLGQPPAIGTKWKNVLETFGKAAPEIKQELQGEAKNPE